MQKFHFSPITANRKTGPIGVITISKNSCPSACAFYKKGCYAKVGHTQFAWRMADKGLTQKELIEKIKNSKMTSNLIRYAVAGDLIGNGNAIDKDRIVSFFSSANKQFFTYTHKPLISGQKTVFGKKISSSIIKRNKAAIRTINALSNATVNLSANTLEHADQLADLKIAPVVCVLDSKHDKPTAYTPKGRTVIVCPAQRFEKVTCADCKLCTRKNRTAIVGFLAHGSQKNAVNEIIES